MQWSWGLAQRARRRGSSRRPTTSSPTWASSRSTPDGITRRPGGLQHAPPTAAFSATPTPGLNQVHVQRRRVDAIPTASITKYEWDLDGNGTYETNTGTNPRHHATPTRPRAAATSACASPTTAARPTSPCGRQRDRQPAAHRRFTATPNPVVVSQTVTFNGSASSDSDGTIAKYEWDLDGNGTFEIDSGATPDDVARPTRPRARVNVGPARHRQRRQDRDGDGPRDRQQRRRLELRRRRARHRRARCTTGAWASRAARPSPTRKGTARATATGGVTLGVPGRPRAATPTRAARFDGVSGSARPTSTSRARASSRSSSG